MAIHASSQFDGATNPDLTPIPFDNVAEDGGNNIFYNAAEGNSTAPCAECFFDGASINCNGGFSFVESDSRLGKITIEFSFRPADLGLGAGDEAGIARLKSGAGNVCTVKIRGQSINKYGFGVRDDPAANNVWGGDFDLIANSDQWHTVRAELDVDDSWTVYVNDVQQATLTMASQPGAVDSARFGGVQNKPAATAEWYYDEITVTYDSDGPPGAGIGGAAGDSGGAGTMWTGSGIW